MRNSLEYWTVAAPSWGPLALYVADIDCLRWLKIDWMNGSGGRAALRWLVMSLVHSRRCRDIVVGTDERFLTRT
jgi:hypothetical protein